MLPSWPALALALLSFTATAAIDPGVPVAQAAADLAAQRIRYVERALGGPAGPEEAGLPAAGLDCVTFVEASVLRAAGIDERPAQERWLRATRYEDRDPAYCTRTHYVSDWIDRNASLGWLREQTAEIAGRAGAALHQHSWSRGWMAEHGADPAHCVGNGTDQSTASYIAPADYGRIAGSVQPGDLIVFVASKPGLDTAHMGIVEAGGGIAMASSSAGRTVRKRDWKDYAERHASRFLGIRVVRISELPSGAQQR